MLHLGLGPKPFLRAVLVALHSTIVLNGFLNFTRCRLGSFYLVLIVAHFGDIFGNRGPVILGYEAIELLLRVFLLTFVLGELRGCFITRGGFVLFGVQ